MKKLRLFIIAFLFSTLLISCSSTFDASFYVKSSLNAMFLHEISDELAEITPGGRNAVELEYQNMQNNIMQIYEMAGCPDSLLEDYANGIQNLLKKAEYSVGEAVLKDDIYTVPVTIHPIDLSEIMNEKARHHLSEWAINQTETPDEQALTYEYFSFVLQEINFTASAPSYAKAETIDMHVVKTEKNLYEIPEEDQSAISKLIIKN